MCHFRVQNDPFLLNNFVGTNHYYYFHLPTGPFQFAKFKKKSSRSELQGCTIFGPKMADFPKWDFFQKTCYWALFLSFRPIYIPKIKDRYYSYSEILTIKEYWNLIGWESFLAETWEPGFSQACSFCRMLMNQRKFHFTQIPDKTNDVTFLKSPLLTIFGIFAQWAFFPKKSGCHTQLYNGP